MTTGFTAGIDAGIGFDAITVALLGRSTPWGIFVAGILFGAFKAGGFSMQAAEGVPIEIVLVVQSLIVLFIAAPPLVRTIFRLPDPASPRRRAVPERRPGGEGEVSTAVQQPAPAPQVQALDTTVVTSWKAPIAFAIFTLLALALAVFAPQDGDTTFRLSTQSDFIQLPEITVPTMPALWITIVLLRARDRVLRRARVVEAPRAALAHRRVRGPVHVRLPHLGRRRARRSP